MNASFILALDQGTGSSKALLLDGNGLIVGKGQSALSCQSPQPGWVEQDPMQIWHSLLAAIAQALAHCQIPDIAKKIVGIGISTQRESCLAWERHTGTPLSPLLSWQDQRTAAQAHTYDASQRSQVRRLTGLPLDPMFSAMKMRWILDEVDPDRQRCKKGDICLGTVDSWLIFMLGGGHYSEAGNASRTQLVDIEHNQYHDDLLSLFQIPLQALPEIVPSSRIFARTRQFAPLPDGIPVAAILADSHAALFAHTVFVPDAIKATQGTGSSIMGLYREEQAHKIHAGLCRTIAWQIDQPQMAFEGNIRAIGSTLNWLADLFVLSTQQLVELANSVTDSAGVVFVPAFGGLGCPWWDQEAQCLIGGMQLGSSRSHFARAALEGVAHQIADVVACVRQSGITMERLCVDGGLSTNTLLMQIEANLTGLTVVCPPFRELSAMGAGYLAGMSLEIWDSQQLRAASRQQTLFHPEAEQQENTRQARARWHDMLARSRADRAVLLNHTPS